MIRTYHGTMLNPDLKDAIVWLYIYDGVKYHTKEEPIEKKIEGLTEWSIVDGEDAKAIERGDTANADENHEYLILRYEDGSDETYRNSHVALFIF